MATVKWGRSAKGQLKETVAFLTRHSKRRALEVNTKIKEAARLLRSVPWMGRVVREFNREDIREVVAAGYRVVYHVAEDRCMILGIVHGGADLHGFLRLDDLDEGN